MEFSVRQKWASRLEWAIFGTKFDRIDSPLSERSVRNARKRGRERKPQLCFQRKDAGRPEGRGRQRDFSEMSDTWICYGSLIPRALSEINGVARPAAFPDSRLRAGASSQEIKNNIRFTIASTRARQLRIINSNRQPRLHEYAEHYDTILLARTAT